jgi:hydrogenase expression/formation protein HypE
MSGRDAGRAAETRRTAQRAKGPGAIELRHGAGGPAMRELVSSVFARGARAIDGIGLGALDDGAALRLGDRWLVFTTDGHVIDPPFFPGGDIGRLAVCGSVNDLAVMGATEVLGLSIAIVIEEGFPRDRLEAIQASIEAACAEADTRVLTGDTKVMRRGELDGVVLTSSAIGLVRAGADPVPDRGLRVGDEIVVTGSIADHGMAVMAARHDLALTASRGEAGLVSDVAPLNGLLADALAAGREGIVAMKDPTRGGVAGALIEMGGKSGVGIVIEEARLPVGASVRAACELLGVDPLVVANEGKALIGVRPEATDAVLAALHAHPLGKQARRIGRCIAEHAGSLILDTGFGRRLVAESDGEVLPRIC